jgi:hypothetical protein
MPTTVVERRFPAAGTARTIISAVRHVRQGQPVDDGVDLGADPLALAEACERPCDGSLVQAAGGVLVERPQELEPLGMDDPSPARMLGDDRRVGVAPDLPPAPAVRRRRRLRTAALDGGKHVQPRIAPGREHEQLRVANPAPARVLVHDFAVPTGATLCCRRRHGSIRPVGLGRRISEGADPGSAVAGMMRTAWSSTRRTGMDDSQIHASIEKLVAEEHELWEREGAGNAVDEDRTRLRELKVSLDQCWDLLRQRQALREAGLDPDAAQARRADVVEGYQQ